MLNSRKHDRVAFYEFPVLGQGNRVKDLRGDDAGEKVIIPGRDLAA